MIIIHQKLQKWDIFFFIKELHHLHLNVESLPTKTDKRILCHDRNKSSGEVCLEPSQTTMMEVFCGNS